MVNAIVAISFFTLIIANLWIQAAMQWTHYKYIKLRANESSGTLNAFFFPFRRKMQENLMLRMRVIIPLPYKLTEENAENKQLKQLRVKVNLLIIWFYVTLVGAFLIPALISQLLE